MAESDMTALDWLLKDILMALTDNMKEKHLYQSWEDYLESKGLKSEGDLDLTNP